MRKLYMLTAVLGVCHMSFAQPLKTHNYIRGNSASSGIIKPATKQSANKTTAAMSRLIGMATSQSNTGPLEVVDSFKAMYSGDKGYDEQLEQWKYDNAMGWDFDNGTAVESGRSSHTFDGAGRIATTKFETKDGTQWVTEELERVTYTSAGLVDVYVYASFDGTDWDSSKTTNIYDGSGRSLGDVSQDWDLNTSSWVNSYRNRTVYSGSLVDSSIFESWDDANNVWMGQIITKNVYISGKLAADTTYLNQTGNVVKSNLGIYTYDANGNVSVELFLNWNPMTSTWRNQNRTTYTYNSSNDVTTSITESYNNSAWVNSSKSEFTYNSFRQPLVQTEYSWNTGQWQARSQNRNYYETYYPTSVRNSASSGNSLAVYPIPAKDKLNIQLTLNDAANASISIYDMSGKVVKYVNLPVAKQINTSIDIATLPAGSYTIKMTGAGEPVMQKLNVVK